MSERMDILVIEETENKSYFTKVGVAFATRNGGWQLKFAPGVSVGGKALMMPPKEREPRRDNRDQGYDGYGG